MKESNLIDYFHKLVVGALFCGAVTFGTELAQVQAQAQAYNGPPISFEQFFQNPDNNELKLNYARQQAAKGDLKSAAGALEGMLYAQPNWDSARLFYAIVLFQLDDQYGAKREFDLLENRPLTEKERRLVDYHQGQLSPTNKGGGKAEKTVKIKGYVEVGVRSDSNASNNLFETTFIVVSSRDTSKFANAALKASIPLLNSGINLNMGLKAQTRNYATFTQSNYEVLSGSVGLSGALSAIDWQANLNADNVYILDEKYLSQTGVQVSLGTKITDTTYFKLMGGAYYQDIEDTNFNPDGRFLSGGKFLLNTSLLFRPTAKLSYGLDVGYERKIATTQFFRYKGFRLGAHVRNEFDNGIYFKANAGLRSLKYGAPNLFVAPPVVRQDDQFSGYAALGSSLNNIGSWMGVFNGSELENLYAEVGIHRTKLNSNIDIFNYQNTGAALKFLWDF